MNDYSHYSELRLYKKQKPAAAANCCTTKGAESQSNLSVETASGIAKTVVNTGPTVQSIKVPKGLQNTKLLW